MSGNIGNNNFSKSTLNAFLKLDKNENNDISIKELKPIDKNKDGNLDNEELKNFGITDKKDIDKISKEFKSHNSEPDKIFFSNNKLDLGTFSKDQFSKYMNIKTVLKNNPEKFNTFTELLRKYNNSNSIDMVLDRTFEKISNVKNPKNIEFSKNDSEATKFDLDVANKILKKVKESITDIPNRHGMRNPKFYVGQINLSFGRLLQTNTNPFSTDLDSNKTIDKIANMAKSIGKGNCQENACLTALESKNILGINKIEIFGMKINSGHAFVVINRDVGSDESKMSTWGKNAIIIDSWSGIAFKAKDYPSDIKNKKHEQFPSGELELIQIYK